MSHDELLEAGLEDIQKDGGAFYNWLVGDDNKCANLRSLSEEMLPYLCNILDGQDKTDNSEDALRELKAWIATYANQKGLLQEDTYGSKENPNDEYDPENKDEN